MKFTIFTNEPAPNGGIVNIGVYGNTSEASKSHTAAVNAISTDKLTIYPNPTTGKIYFSDKYKNREFRVLSITGAIIRQGICKRNYIDLSKLKTGVYTIEMIDGKKGGKAGCKIVKF